MTVNPSFRFNFGLGAIATALVVFASVGCSKKAAEAARDIGPEAQAYYKAHPDFFIFATPADLPKDLVWQDGHDVPEFADPAAKRGGTLTVWHPNAQMQRVMQVTGVPEGVIVVHPPKPEREPRSRWLASLRLRSVLRDRPATPVPQPVT